MPAPTSYSLVRTGSPSSTIAAFAVVPPMSSEIRLAAAGEAAEVAARHHAGRGAGLDQVRRLAPRRLGRERAAARLHHLELGADAGLAQAVDERAEVARDRRARRRR